LEVNGGIHISKLMNELESVREVHVSKLMIELGSVRGIHVSKLMNELESQWNSCQQTDD